VGPITVLDCGRYEGAKAFWVVPSAKADGGTSCGAQRAVACRCDVDSYGAGASPAIGVGRGRVMIDVFAPITEADPAILDGSRG
jgi:hypothetical protein